MPFVDFDPAPLQLYMIRQRISQNGMARLSGVSDQTIRNILSGEGRQVREATSQKLYAVLNRSPVVEYGAGDWSEAEIAAAKQLWDRHNPKDPVARLPATIANAWMHFLPDARTCLEVFRAYTLEDGRNGASKS